MRRYGIAVFHQPGSGRWFFADHGPKRRRNDAAGVLAIAVDGIKALVAIGHVLGAERRFRDLTDGGGSWRRG